QPTRWSAAAWPGMPKSGHTTSRSVAGGVARSAFGCDQGPSRLSRASIAYPQSRPGLTQQAGGCGMTQPQAHESLRVDAELEKEFEEAISYEPADADIERARLLVGYDVASKQRELFSVATPDAIRNWSLGIGDDNPLFTEEDYGPTTRWGSQIGHGSLAGHIKTPMLGDPIPAEIKQQTK